MSDVRASDYCFAVQEASGDRFVEMKPRECDAAALGHLQSVWQRLYGGLQGHHKLCGRPAPDWTAWKPWDWCGE